MNPSPTQTPALAPALALDPDTLAALLRTTVDALPLDPGATAEEATTLRRAARNAIAMLRPRDPIEAYLAVRIVTLHHHASENLRRATETDLPAALQLRYQGRAHGLNKLMDATLLELRDRQTAAALRPAALPAALPAPRAQPAPEAAPASTPPQPRSVEGRHERRRRERAERHLAAAARAPARQPAAVPRRRLALFRSVGMKPCTSGCWPRLRPARRSPASRSRLEGRNDPCNVRPLRHEAIGGRSCALPRRTCSATSGSRVWGTTLTLAASRLDLSRKRER